MRFPVENSRRIAVFRALQLGDMLCTIPALRALRYAYPEAEITLLGLPWAKAFCERFNKYIDQFIHFPGYPGLPEQPFEQAAWQVFEQKMRAQPFDLILQMQGNGSIVNAMLESLQAGPVAGFHSKGNYGDPSAFLAYPEGISEPERHVRLMEHLGMESQGLHLEFPIAENEILHLPHNIPALVVNRYVCVHPGSRGAWRQWPPAHFASLADQCARQGYEVVITGTQAEASVTRQVIEAMQHVPFDLTGQTDLGQIGRLIRDSALLISNCTGVSHIASATQTPSIVISMDGEPERWGPLDKTIHKTFDWTSVQDFGAVARETELLLGKRGMVFKSNAAFNQN